MRKTSGTYQQVEEVLQILNTEYPRPGIDPLRLSGDYDMSTDYPNQYWPHERWRGTGPGGIGVPGVYLFFDSNYGLLYVGKSTCLASRLSSYFRDQDVEGWAPKDTRFAAVRYIHTVSLPKGHWFEAAAVESFLLERLNPPLNTLRT